MRRSSEPGPRRGAVSGLRDLRERDLQLVQTVVTRFVDPRRLTGRPDEQAREEVAQARAPQPMDEEALEQVGTSEERTVERRLPADDDMIAPAGSRMLAVDHELVGAEAREPRFLVDTASVVATHSRQLDAGWMLTSITPGSGATRMTFMRGSTGGG